MSVLNPLALGACSGSTDIMRWMSIVALNFLILNVGCSVTMNLVLSCGCLIGFTRRFRRATLNVLLGFDVLGE